MEETFSDLISQVLLWRKRLPQPVARQLSRDILTLVPVRYQLSRWHFAIRLSPRVLLEHGFRVAGPCHSAQSYLSGPLTLESDRSVPKIVLP